MPLFSSHSHAAHPSKGYKKRKFLNDSRNHRHRSKIAYRDQLLKIIVWLVALSVAASFAIILGHLVWYGS